MPKTLCKDIDYSKWMKKTAGWRKIPTTPATCTVRFLGGPWHDRIMTLSYPPPPDYWVVGDPPETADPLDADFEPTSTSAWCDRYRYLRTGDYEYTLETCVPPKAPEKPRPKTQQQFDFMADR